MKENIIRLLQVVKNIDAKITKISKVLDTDYIHIFDKELQEIEKIICSLAGKEYTELIGEMMYEYSKNRISLEECLEKLGVNID